MQRFFAAANTADGFVSWFDDIFSPASTDYTYIIKGGSGTGKSTLMKNVADAAENLGGSVEYFYCSSDPDSLDGIITKAPSGRRIAILDGTAPHTHDPKLPGVSDEILNLAGYLDKDMLHKEREEIISLAREKSQLFQAAYRYFFSAGELTRSLRFETARHLDFDKLNSASHRLLTKRMHELKFKPKAMNGRKKRIRALSALSVKGEVHFDSFSETELVFGICDAAFSAPFVCEALIHAADSLGISYDIAPTPLLPELLEGIRFPDLSMSVITGIEREDFRQINMNRFVDKSLISKDDRRLYREIAKGIVTLKKMGLNKLSAIKEVHGRLEELYGKAMNFTALSADTGKIIDKILG